MPPPPPQTPDHEEKSGQPLDQRPGQKAGDFIERDLWNLDEEWGEGDGEPAEAKQEAAPEKPAGEPATPPADVAEPPGPDEPVDVEDPGKPAAKAQEKKTAKSPDPETREEADGWDEFDTDEAPEPDTTPPAAEDQEPESTIREKPAAVLTPSVDEDEEGDVDAEIEDPPGAEPNQDPKQEPDLQLDFEDAAKPGNELEKEPALEDLSDAEPDTDTDEDSVTGEEEDESEWEIDSKATPATDDDADSGEPADPDESSTPEFEDELLGITPEPEIKPQKKPKSKRLSKVELVSLAVVLVAVLAGSGWALKTFFADIPTRKSPVLIPDFPVRGELVTVDSAATFWREPIRSGPNPDTARRDAKLIPALELKIKDAKSNGALRVFFRDESGQLVGDSVTHGFQGGVFVVTGNDQLQLAATAGFDDEGKHAGYQTAQTDPWKVEVFEGPGERASFESFKLLFEMPISAERR